MERLVYMLFKLVFFVLKLVFKGLFGPRRKPLPKAFWTRVYVVDGDTVGIPGTKTRIRLHGIDAPERHQRQGKSATQFLKTLLLGKKVYVKPVEYDRYGRVVATLFLGDKFDVNAAMVANGYALAETRYSSAYVRLQKQAAKTRKGLWREGGIENPQAWRAANA